MFRDNTGLFITGVIVWTIISLTPTIYLLHKSRYLKGTPELQKKYDAFYRTDTDKWNFLVFAAIQFFTLIPRMFITWTMMWAWVIFAQIL
jgi:hypothetical protein